MRKGTEATEFPFSLAIWKINQSRAIPARELRSPPSSPPGHWRVAEDTAAGPGVAECVVNPTLAG